MAWFCAFSAAPATGQTPTAYIRKKSLDLRFNPRDRGFGVKREGSGVERAELWLSTDTGNSWRMVLVMDQVQQRIKSRPGKKLSFRFEAKYGDGQYWFIIRLADKANNWNRSEPKKNSRPQYKVIIDSTPPRLEVFKPADGLVVIGGKNLYVQWEMRDLHPPATPVRIEYRLSKTGAWKVLANQLPDRGHIRLPLPYARHPDASIRVTASDRLGNKTTVNRKFSIQTVPEGEQLAPKKKPPVKKRPVARRKSTGVENPGPRVLQLCARARSLLEEARYDKALRSYKQALKLQPRYVAAIFDAGICHYYLKRYREAWKQFDRAIEIDPDNPGLYLRRGHAYFQRGQFPAAMSDLKQALALAGNDQLLEIQCLDLMAEIYRTRQAYAAAVEAWERITQLGDNQQALVKAARQNLRRYRNRIKK